MRITLLVLFMLHGGPGVVAAPGDAPAAGTQADNPGLSCTLKQLDQRLKQISTLRARFVKRRHTPLLKEPLVSRGVVRVKNDMVRWDTQQPEPVITLLRDDEVRIYQPEQKHLEIYPVDQRFARFGGSPVPSLSALRKQFAAETKPPSRLFNDLPSEEAKQYLALELTPRDERMKKRLKRITLLIDRDKGYLKRVRLRHGENEWTTYQLHDVTINPQISDESLEMDVANDVEITRPMDG